MQQTGTTYLTIAAMSEGFYKEKGSKFLAFAHPCTNEEDAKKIIQQLRKEHFQAVHVCSAFRFGSDKKKYRSSDDGEPSNSAGPPILGQLLSFDVTNVLIAVVRYYGGTNLGVGGLINAYKTAAKEALENATIIEQEDQYSIELHFDYNLMPAVMSIMKQASCKITDQQFELTCVLKFIMPLSQSSILEKLKDLDNIKVIEHGISE
ncbi:MAG: YigZ family protein [Fluviicola sp.]|jgi:uncharacterized YigZ family protein|nr:YigZ family protein [Fluviicola sp.]